MIPVTAAVILDGKGRVLLAQRPAADAHPLKWEFPGGKIQEGESPEDCLRREIEEELGIHVQVRDVFHVVNHRYDTGSVLLLAYWCGWVEGEIRLRAHQDYRWVKLPRVPSMDLAEADRPIAEKLAAKSVFRGGRPEGGTRNAQGGGDSSEGCAH